ncbi:unnamed protein product [Darwinula stevensoni]|uniref:6-phosphofructo-2-kinase domain-containing protein n=1 Tax=Darwinula stevensoni TaxID=69355 RepID=A0A7R8WYG4_9CRUS|nr:unnamed protein product [Darwinula stevensoni]CAG0879310.1 unnamed protein product [Darwinula stevensoni]
MAPEPDLVWDHKKKCRNASVRIGERVNYVNSPHVIAMLLRSSTFFNREQKYIYWFSRFTVFNVGEYRRTVTNREYKSHDFFSNDDPEAASFRARCALDCLEAACKWLEQGGEVAVFDATNTTRERRKTIHEIVVEKMGFKLFFVESICDDPQIIDANIREVKVNSPDYKEHQMGIEERTQDFLKRIEHYREVYETLDEKEENHLSFMQIFNTGEKVLVHRHSGHIQSRVVYYLMNIHVTPRTIYLTRHGESVHNLKGRIGGDADLSHRGRQYAQSLAKFVENQNIPNLRVWTSWMKRTIQTGQLIDAPQERWKALNEIDAGICEELTYEEIQDKFPTEFASRDGDKFHYRYPKGESYEDLVGRLEPVIMELERQENVLVVCHQAVMRCLLAYFMEKSPEELPYMKVPLHAVIKLTPVAYGCRLEYIHLNVEAVDTHRPKPTALRTGTEEDNLNIITVDVGLGTNPIEEGESDDAFEAPDACIPVN